MTKKGDGTISTGRRVFCVVLSVVMGLLIIANISSIFCFAFLKNASIYYKQMVTTVGMLFAMVLFIGCFANDRESTRQGKIFTSVAVLLFFLIFLSGMVDVLQGIAEAATLIFFIQTLMSVFSSMIHLLFFSYQCTSLPQSRVQRIFKRIIYALTLIYLVMVIINIFTGFLFYVDESGRIYWPGEMMEQSIMIAFYLLYLLYVLPQRCSVRKKIALASFAVFPLSINALTIIWDFLLDMETVAQAMAYTFLLLAAYVVLFGDYSESRERVLRQKAELAEQKRVQTELRTSLILSQIRPHFLFNAITAIRNLCKNDPQRAYTALGRFADYLRGNIDVLSGGQMISFEKELEHVETYLMLEQMRFEDALRVEYDIQYRDFSLPALTVQPIVENAVRHGATANEDGGVVMIRAEKTASGAVITVTDNGLGFDPASPPTDTKSHYGIENVRDCLMANDCGELTIDSTPGIGTTVKIFIWEEKK